MFDFHIHSRLSFDSEEIPENIVSEAEKRGLGSQDRTGLILTGPSHLESYPVLVAW